MTSAQIHSFPLRNTLTSIPCFLLGRNRNHPTTASLQMFQIGLWVSNSTSSSTAETLVSLLSFFVSFFLFLFLESILSICWGFGFVVLLIVLGARKGKFCFSLFLGLRILPGFALYFIFCFSVNGLYLLSIYFWM